MFIYLVTLLFIALYLLRRDYLRNTRALREYGDKLPGPKPLPIVGNAFNFGLSSKSMFERINGCTKVYGPVSRFWIGPRLAVLLLDPHYIELLVGSMKHNSKSTLFKFGEPWLGKGLIMSSGETWRLHRKIIAPTLSGHLLEQFFYVFNPNLDVLMRKLSEHQNGTSFDIFPLMSSYSLAVICEFAMGIKVDAIFENDSTYFEAVNSLEDLMYRRAMLPWLHSDIIFRMTSLGRRQTKYLSVVKDLTKRIIQARKQEIFTEKTSSSDNWEQDKDIKTKKAFLDHLLLRAKNEEQLTSEDIENEVHTVMAAGHDTTAVNLSFTCWLLAQHQDVQEKIVEELKNVFGDSLDHATSRHLHELKYLECVIKESMRMYPPAPIFARLLTEDFITDKYVIPAGSEIIVNTFMLHRHARYFPDPERFDPDRFLPENCAGRHPYAYMPFGGGPRICVGYKFAMYELKTTLATLLRYFKILPPDNPYQELDLTLQLTLKSINGVPVKLQSRNFMKCNNSN